MKLYEINYKNMHDEKILKYIEKFSNSIKERVELFSKKGIMQWQSDYAERNSANEIVHKMEVWNNITLLVFCDSATDEFIAGAFLKGSERPGYWDEYVEDRKLEDWYELNLNKKCAYISGLVTNNKFKGTNLGKTIIRELAKYCKSKNIELMRLDCYVLDEKDSFLFNFYKKVGFKCVGGGRKVKQPPIVDYVYRLFEADVEDIVADIWKVNLNMIKIINKFTFLFIKLDKKTS